MPICKSFVPNAHSDSPQMLTGNGLELSGGKLSLKDFAKGAKVSANIGLPLASAFGVPGASEANQISQTLQGMGYQQGGAFGKGTQRKMLAAAKKGAKVADKLIDEFGDEDQKRKKKNTAKKVAQVVSGSGAGGFSVEPKSSRKATPAAALRKMVS